MGHYHHFEPYVARDSMLHRLDARTKLLAALGILAALVTTPQGALLTFPCFAPLVFALFLFARVPLGLALKRSLVVLPLVAMVAMTAPFLPAQAEAGALPHAALVLWPVFWKAWLGVLCTIWLMATTRFPDLLTGLARLRVPGVLVLLTGFVYRYLFVIADEVVRMRRALTARGFQMRRLWHAGVLGQVAGTLFLRSHARAERTYWAMLARGYTGRPLRAGTRALRGADYAFLGAALAVCIALRGTLG